MFKFKSHMFKCKMNYRSDHKFKSSMCMCDSCQSEIDSQAHVLICPSYRKLKEDKNMYDDKDLAEYLVKVLRIREDFGFLK